jgi:hypothetical protein
MDYDDTRNGNFNRLYFIVNNVASMPINLIVNWIREWKNSTYYNNDKMSLSLI